MYALPLRNEPISQGDIIDGCPVFALEGATASRKDAEPTRWETRIVVLTQACDLVQQKTSRILVALVHVAQDLVSDGVLTESVIRDRIRRGQVFGWYFLPSAPPPISFPESIVDLRDVHTVSRQVLEELVASHKRVCRLLTPYREHLAQHFAVTYSRIGLPEPYETES